jgi:glyoxylase I family protein
MVRYAHTSIVARDAGKLIDFYKTVLGCKSIGETRDLSGGWLDRLTGVTGAHIAGEHLLLPGYGSDGPTLEIFSYSTLRETVPAEINRPGIAHIAFAVEDVKTTLSEIIKAGGSSVGELVTARYGGDLEGAFVYARDPEGNIVELQSWRKAKEPASK